MKTHTGLTIQDYFQRGNVQNPILKTSGQRAFVNMLDAASKTSMGANKGMTICDYRQRPVCLLNRPSHDIIREPAASLGEMKSGSPIAIERNPKAVKTSKAGAPPMGVSEPRSTETIFSAEPRDQIHETIEQAAERFELAPALIRAVIKAESDYQVQAVSPAGAQGLMQLMPATARELGVKDPFDIVQNINGGAQYLRKMLDLFKGNLRQALSAYNAGPGTVMKYGGEVPYEETRNYVQRVLDYARRISMQEA